MHVLIVAQHYNSPDCPADGRLYALAARWAERHEVTVVTGSAARASRLSDRFPWAPPGVRVIEVPARYDNAMGTLRRLVSFGRFAAGSLWAALRVPRPDVVYTLTPPPSAAWAARLAARYHRVPYVLSVRDLWPDFPIQMGALESRLARSAARRQERTLYRDAAHIVTVSPDMQAHVDHVSGTPDRVSLSLHGTDLDLVRAADPDRALKALSERGLEERRIALYAGSYGRGNGIPTLLDLAERLQGRDDVCFVLMGSGFHAERVAAVAERLPNVIALDPQPRWSTFDFFRAADLALVPFADLPVMAANAPTKFFDALASATPVLVTNDGWTRRFVEEHACGWFAPISDPEALALQLTRCFDAPEALKAHGARGQAVAEAYFDRYEAAAQVERKLSLAAADRAAPDPMVLTGTGA